MTEDPGSRPSLRLIAGDLVSGLAHEVEAVAELAGIGLLPRSPRATSTAEVETDLEPTGERPRVIVIGGGIAGLTAAWSLVRDRNCDAEVTVYESSDQVGGKLKLDELEGIVLDAGAESLLAVRPEAVALARSVGLGQSIVNPVTTSAGVVARDVVRDLPTGLISGIPTDLRALAASDVMSLRGLLRIPLDHVLPKTSIDVDISVGDYVATRLGGEVVDRLVEPMLGGVYAGRAEELSLEMAVPVLFRLAKRERSLLAAANEVRKTGAAPSGARRGPVFAGITGGVGRLPLALADRLRSRGVGIELNTSVSGIRRTDKGWRVLVTQGDQTVRKSADVVILAVPAPVAARLLRHVNPSAALVLDTVGYASVAVTTFLYEARSIPTDLRGSGFLVPPVEGYSIKAATYSSRKWAWVDRAGAATGRGKARRPDFFVVRASQGRYGEPAALELDDRHLAARAACELNALAGLPLRPVAHKVSRWDDALPQYTVGHRSRMARVRGALVETPGLSVCGAAYDGVGIAACVGSAQVAAGQVSGYLAQRRQLSNG